MEEQIKKYIRGNANRGHEVIAELEKLGGKNTRNYKGTEYDDIYFITPYKLIDTARDISFIGQLILTNPDWEEIELPKDKYPKTYEECCKKLNIEIHDLIVLDNILDTKEIVYRKNLDRLLNSFRKLLICRDAYWKIAGEEMGLGKSWEPDFLNPTRETRYFLFCTGITIEKGQAAFPTNKILIFPTEEMRDAFKENFKKELEICKELL